MPGFNGTGPRGMGPMTAGGRGFCNPYSSMYGTGFGYRPGFGRPMGRGRGRGMGFGRGMRYSYGAMRPPAAYPYGVTPYAPHYAPYPYGW
jgi:hypothetical protein